MDGIKSTNISLYSSHEYSVCGVQIVTLTRLMFLSQTSDSALGQMFESHWPTEHTILYGFNKISKKLSIVLYSPTSQKPDAIKNLQGI